MQRNTANKAVFWFYNLAWTLAIPLFRRNQRLADGFEQRMFQQKAPAADIWIQAASAGEAYLADSILNALKTEQPLNIIVTANTRQGMDILKHTAEKVNTVSRDVYVHLAYFPFDKPDIMTSVVRAICPKIMVLLESEIWPGLFSVLKKNKCKILIINGRITPKSLKRYQIYPGLWRTLKPDKVLAVSENDASRFNCLFGSDCSEVMPNIKFDRFRTSAVTTEKNPLSRLFSPDVPLLVLGSTSEAEEPDVEKIITSIRQQLPQSVIALFPRHMHRIAQWQKKLNQMKLPWLLRSEIRDPVSGSRIILWDTFGELQFAYALAHAAFVGGSLAPAGGQNFLEPLAYGIIPVIGPYWDTFEWVGHDIVTQGLVRVAVGWKAVSDILVRQISHPSDREAITRTAHQYIKDRQGGTIQACHLITEMYLQNTH